MRRRESRLAGTVPDRLRYALDQAVGLIPAGRPAGRPATTGDDQQPRLGCGLPAAATVFLGQPECYRSLESLPDWLGDSDELGDSAGQGGGDVHDVRRVVVD